MTTAQEAMDNAEDFECRAARLEKRLMSFGMETEEDSEEVEEVE